MVFPSSEIPQHVVIVVDDDPPWVSPSRKGVHHLFFRHPVRIPGLEHGPVVPVKKGPGARARPRRVNEITIMVERVVLWKVSKEFLKNAEPFPNLDIDSAAPLSQPFSFRHAWSSGIHASAGCAHLSRGTWASHWRRPRGRSPALWRWPLKHC